MALESQVSQVGGSPDLPKQLGHGDFLYTALCGTWISLKVHPSNPACVYLELRQSSLCGGYWNIFACYCFFFFFFWIKMETK